MSATETETTRTEDPGRPLSEDEKALLKRILAEPLEFPIEFRSWLKNFFETSGIILPRSSIAGYSGTGVRFDDFPPGVVMAWAGTTLPSAALPCNGAAVTRDFYKDLFAQIGTAWGVGDGTTTFNVPDLRDRALYGAGSKVGLAATDGGSLGTRGPSHTHDLDNAGWHGHGMNNAGYHGHGMSGAGGHGHSMGAQQVKAINGADQNVIIPTTGGSDGFYTTGVGDHGHSIYGDGEHSHGIDGAGEHSHGVSGGGLQDTPGFAGVQYVITTGKTA